MSGFSERIFMNDSSFIVAECKNVVFLPDAEKLLASSSARSVFPEPLGPPMMFTSFFFVMEIKFFYVVYAFLKVIIVKFWII